MKVTRSETKRTRIMLTAREVEELLIQALRDNDSLPPKPDKVDNVSILFDFDDSGLCRAEIVEDRLVVHGDD